MGRSRLGGTSSNNQTHSGHTTDLERKKETERKKAFTEMCRRGHRGTCGTNQKDIEIKVK